MRGRAAAPVILATAILTGAGLPACGRAVTPPAPAPPRALLTTDGVLAASNLDAEIAQAERQRFARPGDVAKARALVERLLARAQIAGRLADLDRALSIADQAVSASPTRPEAHLVRGRALAALHAFPAALRELDAADQWNGAAGDPVRQQALRARVAIWEATGEIDRALPYLHAWRRDRPDLETYGAEASAYADKRDFASAGALFAEARRHYDDVSPLAVAWLEFQEAHAWEVAGRWDRAWPLYQSAHARLPIHAAAAGHLAVVLAAFGDPEHERQAVALLEAIVARSDDPEYVGQLAALYRRLGRIEDGDRLAARAAVMFEELLRRHPEAIYDHAARFYAHVAGDPRRALALAEANLSLRATADARDLYAEIGRLAASSPAP